MRLSSSGLCLAADSAIDLHLHTIYSDGRWTPGLLLDYLRNAQFSLAAVADHDRPDTAATIQQLALNKRLPVLMAAEMSSTWKGELTDLLCYGFNDGPNPLSDLARDVFRRQQENTREVCENLQRQGYVLSPDELSLVLAQPSSQQPHALVALLQERGDGLGGPSAGEIVFEAGCAFATSDPAAIAEAAHRSGAVCLLAHPGRGDGFVAYDIELLDQFRQEVPIDGLEAFCPVHTQAQTAMYREYAESHRWLTSAGSDSHGPDKPPIPYRAKLSRGLLERLGIRLE